MAECKNFARDIVNGRVNKTNVASIVSQVEEFCKDNASVKLVIIKDKELVDEGMNLLYSVGKGSCDRPAFINMTYRGDAGSDDLHSIIGKGIVFDTGGLNIKPTGFMEDMYTDKGGAAAVFGAFKGIVESGLKVNLTCSIPLAENSISSKSYRPSDIITSKKGITVEITNTDAEGRLILADAMTWTQENHKVSSMIELSTLTGACLVALGDRTAGLFGNSKELIDDLYNVGKGVGEDLWRLPIQDHIKKGLKGSSSDLVNSSKSRYGGASEAAAFLENFVEEGVDWCHVDIAGPSLARAAYGNYEKGATGFGVGFLMNHFNT